MVEAVEVAGAPFEVETAAEEDALAALLDKVLMIFVVEEAAAALDAAGASMGRLGTSLMMAGERKTAKASQATTKLL